MKKKTAQGLALLVLSGAAVARAENALQAARPKVAESRVRVQAIANQREVSVRTSHADLVREGRLCNQRMEEAFAALTRVAEQLERLAPHSEQARPETLASLVRKRDDAKTTLGEMQRRLRGRNDNDDGSIQFLCAKAQLEDPGSNQAAAFVLFNRARAIARDLEAAHLAFARGPLEEIETLVLRERRSLENEIRECETTLATKRRELEAAEQAYHQANGEAKRIDREWMRTKRDLDDEYDKPRSDQHRIDELEAKLNSLITQLEGLAPIEQERERALAPALTAHNQAENTLSLKRSGSRYWEESALAGH